MNTHIAVAWWVTFVCIVFSARIATTFLRRNPRMFTVMALFACGWTLVLGAYGTPDERMLSDLITDIAAFLDVYIGGLLMAEGRANEAQEEARISPLQVGALILLLFIAAPRAYAITVPQGTIFSLTLAQTKAYVSAALVTLGFGSIGLGARSISRGAPFIILATILVIYIACDVAYNLGYWPIAGSEWMPITAAFTFAALKAAFTLTFGSIVAYHGMSDEVRNRGPSYWVLSFFGLAF
jgi:hypothetical protein